MIDLATPIREICQRLELDPSMVRSLALHRDKATATVYRLNSEGNKHLDADGEPAVDTVDFDVNTYTY